MMQKAQPETSARQGEAAMRGRLIDFAPRKAGKRVVEETEIAAVLSGGKVEIEKFDEIEKAEEIDDAAPGIPASASVRDHAFAKNPASAAPKKPTDAPARLIDSVVRAGSAAKPIPRPAIKPKPPIKPITVEKPKQAVPKRRPRPSAEFLAAQRRLYRKRTMREAMAPAAEPKPAKAPKTAEAPKTLEAPDIELVDEAIDIIEHELERTEADERPVNRVNRPKIADNFRAEDNFREANADSNTDFRENTTDEIYPDTNEPTPAETNPYEDEADLAALLDGFATAGTVTPPKIASLFKKSAAPQESPFLDTVDVEKRPLNPAPAQTTPAVPRHRSYVDVNAIEPAEQTERAVSAKAKKPTRAESQRAFFGNSAPLVSDNINPNGNSFGQKLLLALALFLTVILGAIVGAIVYLVFFQ